MVESLLEDVPDEASERLIEFLPVFYSNLDAARIPREALLDIPSTFTEGAVMCAFISLRCLYSMSLRFGLGIPPATFPDLWPRLWTWVQFFDIYREQYPEDSVAGSGFIVFASPFTRSHKPTLASTPGFRRMLTRIWGPLQVCGNPLRVAIGLDRLTTVLFSELKVKTRRDVDEVIEGAGGSLSDLADLVVSYIDQITSDGGTPVLKQESRLLGTIFDFVDDVDRVIAGGTPEKDTLGPFSAILSRNAVRSVTAMLNVLIRTESRFHDLYPLLRRSLVFLMQIFLGAPDRGAMTNALHAGLLQVVILSGARDTFNQILKPLIDDVLPSSLMRYYEILFISDELRHLKALANTNAFQSCAVIGPWNQFISLAEERIQILRAVHAEEYHLKACDNAKVRRFVYPVDLIYPLVSVAKLATAPGSSAVPGVSVFITAPWNAKSWIGARETIAPTVGLSIPSVSVIPLSIA